MTTCTRPRCDRAARRGHDLCQTHLYATGQFKPRVPVQPVRDHLATCIDGGATYGGIAAATGVATVTIMQLMGRYEHRDQHRVGADVAEKLMRATPDMSRFVPAWPYTRRVRALRAAGHTINAITDHLGLSVCTIIDLSDGKYTRLRDTTAETVRASYESMSAWPVRPIDPRTLNRQWAPPMAWSDIDDPDEDHTPPPGAVQAAGPVIAAILELVGEYGMEPAADVVGVSRETIRKPLAGERQFMLKRSALAILRAQAALHRKAVAA
ncbi:hypothetical protein ACT3TD_13800 [Corynebacterium sp. AOP36-E1-14]|uniref:hypothetical protein n=1 Tax=Corynebacterium sp. AOP36-E1-14 TaxID=3457682 RepID=UPI004033FF70